MSALAAIILLAMGIGIGFLLGRATALPRAPAATGPAPAMPEVEDPPEMADVEAPQPSRPAPPDEPPSDEPPSDGLDLNGLDAPDFLDVPDFLGQLADEEEPRAEEGVGDDVDLISPDFLSGLSGKARDGALDSLP